MILQRASNICRGDSWLRFCGSRQNKIVCSPGGEREALPRDGRLLCSSGGYSLKRLRPREPSDGKLDGGECDDGREGVSEVLVVFRQASNSADPREGPFGDPPARHVDPELSFLP